jgi:hypothetical protein
MDATIESVTGELKALHADRVVLERAKREQETAVSTIERTLGDMRERHTEKVQQLLGLIEAEGERIADQRKD